MKNGRNLPIKIRVSVMIVTLEIVATIIVACGSEGGNEKSILVAPQMVDCEGAGPQNCLLIKDNPEDEWQLW
jgi:hypothetical protein